MNGDSRLDLITVSPGGESVRVLPGLAGGGFLTSTFNPISTGAGTGPTGLVIGDVNADGRPDIITANPRNSTAGLLLGKAGGDFVPVSTYSAGAGGGALNVALGDFNGDGRPDIVTANRTTSTIGVLFNTGLFVPTASAHTTADDLQLFPNPSQGYFTVQLPVSSTQVQVELFNFQGQVVRRLKAYGPNLTIKTNGLALGTYVLRLQTSSICLIKRIVLN